MAKKRVLTVQCEGMPHRGRMTEALVMLVTRDIRPTRSRP